METTYYLPVAGTDHPDDPWVVDSESPHTRFMRRNGFEPLRRSDGQPWKWRATMQGLWWQGIKVWKEDAESFANFMAMRPYWARIAFGHSHGGQLPIIACAKGLKLRALVTIGTPVRFDVDAEAAVKNIGTWVHVYDVDKDKIQSLRRTLGQLGDWRVSFERRFLLPGVQNIGLHGIDHSLMVRDESTFHHWVDDGILDVVRTSSSEPR